ncbi:MAG: fibronectin type III domain-containing protein, partial [Candidatus Omnitrophica bacterium]|nr:fibronectin type III domain-containing protein [Candidatus Omnitrophota bacterium]
MKMFLIIRILFFTVIGCFWLGNSFAEKLYIPGHSEEEWDINSQIFMSNNESQVIGYLADQRNSVRLSACMRLREIGTSVSLSRLHALAENDTNYDVKVMAARADWEVNYRLKNYQGQEDWLLTAVLAINSDDENVVKLTPPEVGFWAMDLLGERGVSRAKPSLQAIIDSAKPLSEQLRQAARENIALIEFINSHSPGTYIDFGLTSEELRIRRFALGLLVKQRPQDLLDRLNQLLDTARQNQDFEFIYYLSLARDNEEARTQLEPIKIEFPADQATIKTSSVDIIGYIYGAPFEENFKLKPGVNIYTKTVTRDGTTTSKSITINRKDPPAIIFNTIPNKIITINKTLTFELIASNPDPENSKLLFFVYDLPTKADFNYSTRTFSWTPKGINSGKHTVLFVAEDGYGHSLTRQAKITVTGATSSAPKNLKITGNQAGKVSLSWKDNSTIETGFRIMRGRVDIPYWFIEVGTVNANVKVFQDNTIEPKTQYQYRVCAYNADGDSAYSNVAKVTTVDSIPDAPSELAASVISGTKINLTWEDNSSNESGFKLQRSLNSSFNNSTVIDLAVNTAYYEDENLTPNTTYYYRIYAFNNIGNSAYSNIVSAVTLEYTPAAPSNLSATATASNQADLSWMDNSQAEDGFKLERATNATFSDKSTIKLNANVTAYSDLQLNANTKYYYRICAYNENGDSAYSNVVSVTTPENLPLAPTGLTATAVSANKVDLRWSDNSNNETKFNIYRRTGASGDFALLTFVAANVAQYTDNSVAASTLYYYRVKAVNSVGESYHTEASVTTPSPVNAPTSLAANATSSSAIALNWYDNSNNETGFEIHRSTSSTGTYSKVGEVGANVNVFNNNSLS